MANETWKFVQAKSKQAMKQVLGIRDDEKARMTVTPPLAMAPVTQEDDMRWNPKEELAALAMVPGDDDYFRAHNLPPPSATRLPHKARTRAYMPGYSRGYAANGQKT